MAFNIVAGVNNAVYGSVSGSGSYVEGAEVTLEVTANDGYRFVSWDDGSTDNPRVFNASEDVTLVATLEAIPEYAISVTTNDNSLGTVSGSGTFREGTSTQISATPYVHSRFVNWEDGNSDNPRTIIVSAATTYKAIFEAVNYFTISTDVNDANLGSVTGAGEYDEGDTVTLTAVPEIDCRFVSWNDGNTDNPRIFTSSADITYTATFEEIQYTDVTIASNDVSWGTVSGATSGNIETGTTITLTAIPATDYKFDGWQVDGEIVSTYLTASFLVDGQEMDIIAVFSAIVFYQVTLITNDVDCGSISVVSATAEPRGEAHNIWPDGTIINLQAVTTEGGRFLNWSTGQAATEITVNVHGNETIRANFYPATGLILVTKKIFQHAWNTIKSFFSASTGASKIGAPANNALGATTLADVVNSVGQANGLAQLNEDGKINISDLGGSGSSGLAVDITGNAATATSASSADVAAKIGTTTIGSSTEPVYINAGTPTACGGSLAVDITGNAATATDSESVKVWYSTSNANRPLMMVDDTAVSDTLHKQEQGVYCGSFYANPSTGVLSATGGFLGQLNAPNSSQITDITTITASTKSINYYADIKNGITGLFTASNNANAIISIDRHNTSGGKYNSQIGLSSNGNIYYRSFNNVVPDSTTAWKQIAFTDSDITGNAATATTASACSGNAATATTATNTNNAKLTHTVGNTEYPLVFGSSFVITDAQQALRIGTPTATAANCALRCKSYCAAANTQGESYLVIGNNLAKASANNSRGGLYLYGTGTTWAYFRVGDQTANKTVTLVAPADVTLTLPSATGTIALTSSDITGNAATATTASACSGNAASSTYATNIRVTSTKNNNYYYVVGTSGNTASTNYAPAVFPNITIRDDTDSTSEVYSRLRLGNATAKGTSGGKTGCLTLYGNNTKLCNILGPEGASADFCVRLPNSAGTLALTSSNITGNAATATKLKTAVKLKISDGTTSGTETSFDGSAGVTLNLPTTIVATINGDITGNSNSTTNIRVTDTDSNTWYPLVFSSGSAASTNYAARVDADSILVYPGVSPAAGKQGYCYMQLGNAKTTTAAGNKRGVLRIYGTGTSYTEITSATVATARSISFPDKAGTVALTSDIPASANPADYVAAKSLTYTAGYVSGYIKWNSGLLETFGYTTTTKTGEQNLTISFPTAVPFVEIPVVYVTHSTSQDIGTGYDVWASSNNPATVTTTSFKIYLNASYNTLKQVSYRAIGKWK